ncbi:glycosyltransferase family 4 protein [Lutibacter sp. TH_r2]|uniref:glycosyltransferase n=1 Tax=Lutibacter sp. TH_r2 TaxID=3082083 RepID=UPI002955CFBF|nr:glycosyltransferase family 4 protein [Lutibacter sp. TH_r2]MDV7187586.1 glycosyltransferase family 4 protein [Lutibacter sp. TH_r2]
MKNLLIIGFVWPEPNATAAGSRMLQLIQLFIKNNYQISFASTASNKNKSINFEELNINTFLIELNNASFNSLLKEINPSVVMFDRFLTEEQFGWRVSEVCPNAIKILDTEDLHFLRKARQNAFKTNTEVNLKMLQNEIATREIASIYRCDLTLIISKYEIELLQNKFNIAKSLLVYTPFLLNAITSESIKDFPLFNNRKDFISVGNFLHEPNWNAVLKLKKDIWPKIRKQLPNTNLNIYGGYLTEKAKQLHNKNEGFLVKGWVENIKLEFINSKVLLAPIQFGAGLKGKLIDSMVYGTPNVTTTIGSEGMKQNLNWNGYIENNDTNFTNNAVKLYNNEQEWICFQQNGIELINKNFNKKEHGKKLINTIQYIKNNLQQHRSANFIGKILQHHTLKSTKYMSKWIEEKNKTILK